MDSISTAPMRCVADGQHVVQDTEYHNLSSTPFGYTCALDSWPDLRWWGLTPIHTERPIIRDRAVNKHSISTTYYVFLQ